MPFPPPFSFFAARLFTPSPPSRVGEPVRLGQHCQQRVGSRNYYSIRFGLLCGMELHFVWHCFTVVYLRQRPSAPAVETQLLSMVPTRAFPSWLSGNKIKWITPAHLLSVSLAGGEKQKQNLIPPSALRWTTLMDSCCDVISFHFEDWDELPK